MLKEKLKKLFNSVYLPEIDPKTFIPSLVSQNYCQIVDGHQIDFHGFIQHVIKQRELVKDVSFEFRYLIEEGDTVASLHQVRATKIENDKKIHAQVHAFFRFEDGLLINCDERTEILEGEKDDENLGRIQ